MCSETDENLEDEIRHDTGSVSDSPTESLKSNDGIIRSNKRQRTPIIDTEESSHENVNINSEDINIVQNSNTYI